MTAGAELPGSAAGGGAPAGGRAPRPPEEVLRDLELERARLVEAIGQVKFEARALKERFLSRRALAIAAGAVVALVVVRWVLKRR